MRTLARTIAVALLAAPVLPAAAGNVHDVTVEAAFADVKQDLSDAIVNRGLIIDHNAKIGDMLARTREAAGSDKTIYKDAETVQFCSALLSRRMMEADPANIAYCPFIIFYYERADEPGIVHLGFRELDGEGSEASKAAIGDINALLGEIVREAVGE